MRIYLTQHGLAVPKDVDPDRPLLAFQPGTLACLEKDPDGGWALAWMLRPELLAPA